MSHHRLKTTYNEEGSYGATDKKTLYAHHNLSVDYVTFYLEDGSVLMTVPDTLDNNILDAINRLYHAFEDGRELVPDVERTEPNEIENLKP